jgi:hypothetical protein
MVSLWVKVYDLDKNSANNVPDGFFAILGQTHGRASQFARGAVITIASGRIRVAVGYEVDGAPVVPLGSVKDPTSCVLS